MFQYDANMNKVPMNFAASSNKHVIENYSDGDDNKCPKWLWWVLGGVAVILLIVAVVMFVRSRKKSHYSSLPVHSGSPNANMSFGGAQRFGFRFF